MMTAAAALFDTDSANNSHRQEATAASDNLTASQTWQYMKVEQATAWTVHRVQIRDCSSGPRLVHLTTLGLLMAAQPQSKHLSDTK
eukprot:1974402-Rhodomonas_salina.2